MEFEKILQLIKAVSDSSLTHFQMEDGELKLSLKTDKAAKGMPAAVEQVQGLGGRIPTGQHVAGYEGQPGQAAEESGQPVYDGRVIKAPLVGTFYQSASPDDEAFVQAGDVVKKGQTLGIVEAMKLMNEIESEFEGTVTQILVENEQVVEYGQPLFVIR